MSSSEPGGARITVSEDKLDSKLAGLELRLVDRITKALDSKADAAVVNELRSRLHTMQSSLVALQHLPVALAEVLRKHEELESHVSNLQQAQASSLALSSWQRFFFGTVALGVLGALGTISWLLGH